MTAYFPTGLEISVNTQTVGTQSMQSATRLADGSFVVVWQTSDASQDGSGSAIKMQHFSATGVKIGPELLVNTATTGNQTNPQVALLANGNYVVTWQSSDPAQDGSGSAIKAQIFDFNGAKVGNELLVNSQSALGQEFPNITALANGGFVIAWQTTDSAQDGSGTAIRAQAFAASGSPGGAEFLVNTTTAGNQTMGDIVALADGGYLVTWTGNNQGSFGLSGEIFAQAYNADHTVNGSQFLVTNAAGNQTYSSVAALADGGFVVSWYEYNTGVQAQRFDAGHIAVGGQLIPASSPALNGGRSYAATLANGDFVISWEVPGNGGVYVQEFSPTGTSLGAAVRVAGTAGEGSSYSSSPVVALNSGGFVVIDAQSPNSSADLAMNFFRLNTAPELGAASRSVSVLETSANSSSGTISVSATDDGGPVAPTYSIVGGADAARFAIDLYSGNLTFVSGPNFEAPTDANGDNIYVVVVRASDTDLFDEQTINVTVTNYNEAPIFSSNGGGTSANISMAENGAAVTTVLAVDPEGTAVTYAISGGLDASRFTINSTTGLLQFLAAPNFESPTDSGANNVYNVTVSATSSSTVFQSLAITITNANEPPTITSNGGGDTAAVTIAENGIAVTSVAAVDVDGTAPSYSIAGGADAALFAINSATGALSFIAAPNFELPGDGDGNNVYDVIVQASDGQFSDTQTLAVTVTNVNETLSITSGSSFSVAENQTNVATITAVDPEGVSPVYSITGGADAASFTIDALTGALSFVSAPDFESPGDSGGDNLYNVTVQASDGTFIDTRALTISVTDTNEAVAITSAGGGESGAVSVTENTLAVTTVTASDPENAARTYTIAGGADAALFAIDPVTGALSFIAAPNFEAPADVGGNNVYDVIVSASDGVTLDSQTLSVSVENTNEGLSFTSPAAFGTSENGVAVATVSANDLDGDTVTYSIAGGADAAHFTVDTLTGALSFVSAPDFEAPGDANSDNIYSVVVSASDGSLTATSAIAVTVGNVNEGVTITSAPASGIAEGGAAVSLVTASDLDGDTLVFSISGGTDAALFAINAQTGALTFIAAPDYETPGDAGGNNVYDVIVSASDGVLTDSQALAITVTNLNEAPVITSNGGDSTAAISVSENGAMVTAVASTDPEGTARTYAIIGGTDALLFAINAQTGALTFIAAPDYETPGDAGGNNVYDVIVSASDGVLTDSQALAITVTNLNEAPVITSNGGDSTAAISVSENGAMVTAVASTDPEGTARTYAIIGGTDALLFAINAQTGALTFVTAPDYEAAGDTGGNNVYDVIVSASDGSLSDTQTLAITVTNVNEAPIITSNGGGATATVLVNENTTAVTTVASTDPEGTARTYAISGGTDAARFTINATTGVLSFVAAPNYEAPTDSNGDNVYQVIVSSSDGSLTDTQTLSVGVANVVDGVTLTGTSKANTLTGGTAEDTISGLGGADTLSGLGGNDALNGGDGNDTLTGGAGADNLTGGAGADTFVYAGLSDSTAAILDFITDFNTSQSDRISLSALDANANVAGDQAFSWVGTGAFTGVAGQLRYYQSNGDTFVTGDVNGDGVGDFLIQMDPLLTLAAANFVL